MILPFQIRIAQRLLEGHQRRRGDYTAVVIESLPVGLDRALQAELAAVRVDEHD